MPARVVFMRRVETNLPTHRLPKMLNRPIRARDQALMDVSRPQRATTPGRWVAMKATWKPQVKKPAVRRRKLGSREAVLRADFKDWAPAFAGETPGAGAAEGAGTLRVMKRMAGMARRLMAPRITSAGCQPARPMKRPARGITVNWPKEPPALTMPLATLRLASGICFAMADMRRPGPMAPAPVAASNPIRTIRAPVEVASGVRAVARPTRRAPAIITGRTPWRSAMAPATGMVMPHMSWPTAKARLIEA